MKSFKIPRISCRLVLAKIALIILTVLAVSYFRFIVNLSAVASDGSDITEIPLDSRFPEGVFVAMCEGRTFHFYSWSDIVEEKFTPKIW